MGVGRQKARHQRSDLSKATRIHERAEGRRIESHSRGISQRNEHLCGNGNP